MGDSKHMKDFRPVQNLSVIADIAFAARFFSPLPWAIIPD